MAADIIDLRNKNSLVYEYEVIGWELLEMLKREEKGQILLLPLITKCFCL